MLAILVLAVPVRAADPVPLSHARLLLTDLEKSLKKRKLGNGELIAAVDRVLHAYRALAPDDDTPAALREFASTSFRKQAEAALMDAVTLKRVTKGTKHNERTAVNVRALRALRFTRPEISKRLTHTLEHTVFKDRDYDPDPVFYDEAFETLVRLNHEESFDWTLDECVTTDIREPQSDRLLAALDAMMRFEKVPGHKRYAVVRKIVFQFESVESQAMFGDYGDMAGARGRQNAVEGPMLRYWMKIHLTILRAMRHFGTDPRTGEIPLFPRTDRPIRQLVGYTRWFSHHKRKERPPWVDPKEERFRTTRLRSRAPAVTTGRRHVLPWWVHWTSNRDIERRSAQGTIGAKAPVTGKRESFSRATIRRELIPILETATSIDEELDVRTAAAIALGRLRAVEARDGLLHFLINDPSPSMREAATLGLLLLRDDSVHEHLDRIARDKTGNRTMRAWSVLALAMTREVGTLGGARPVVADLQAYEVLGAGFRKDESVATSLAGRLRDRHLAAGARAQIGPALARLSNTDVLPDLVTYLRTRKAGPGLAIALGALVDPDDAKTLRLVEKAARSPKDYRQPMRVHLLLALGQIGGPDAYDGLVDAYAEIVKDARRYPETGYALLAIARTKDKRARAFLQMQFRTLKHEEDLAACAIALALVGDESQAGAIRSRLAISKHEYPPHGAIALAMLGDAGAPRVIRELLDERRDMALFREGVLALAILEGENAAPDLLQRLEWAQSEEQIRAIGRALSLTESRKVVDALLAIYRDRERRPIERATAIETLGRMAASKDALLLSRIARGMNIHAPSPTLPALLELR